TAATAPTSETPTITLTQVSFAADVSDVAAAAPDSNVAEPARPNAASVFARVLEPPGKDFPASSSARSRSLSVSSRHVGGSVMNSLVPPRPRGRARARETRPAHAGAATPRSPAAH